MQGAAVLEVVHRTERLSIATGSTSFVTIWTAPPELADVTALERHQRAAIDRAPGACSNLGWLRPAAVAALPDAAVRARTRKMLDELGPSIAANAQIVDATGFTGAAIRAFLTSLGVLTRPPHPTRVCASVEDAVDWLARRPTASADLLDRAPTLAKTVRSLSP